MKLLILLSLYLTSTIAILYTKSSSDFCSFLQGGTAVGGDIIQLTAGVYDRCDINKGGQSGNPLTITAQQSGQVFFRYNGTAANVFDVSASYITIQGLYFDGSQKQIHAINIKDSVSGIVIQGNTFKGLYGAAVYVNKADDIQVIENQALDSSFTPFIFGNENGQTSVTNILVKRNLIVNITNPFESASLNATTSAGIHFRLNSWGLIRDNSIYETRGPGIQTYGWNLTTSQTTIIEGNYIERAGTDDYGIAIGGGPAIVRNNVLNRCLSGLIGINYKYRNLQNNIQFIFNTIINCSTSAAIISLSDWTAIATGNIFAYNAMFLHSGTNYLYPVYPDAILVGNKNATSSMFYNTSIPLDLWPKLNLLNAAQGESWIPSDDFMGVPRPANADAGAFQHSDTMNNHTLYSFYTTRPLRVGETSTTSTSTSTSTSTTSTTSTSISTTSTTSTSTSTTSTTSTSISTTSTTSTSTSTPSSTIGATSTTSTIGSTSTGDGSTTTSTIGSTITTSPSISNTTSQSSSTTSTIGSTSSTATTSLSTTDQSFSTTTSSSTSSTSTGLSTGSTETSSQVTVTFTSSVRITEDEFIEKLCIILNITKDQIDMISYKTVLSSNKRVPTYSSEAIFVIVGYDANQKVADLYVKVTSKDSSLSDAGLENCAMQIDTTKGGGDVVSIGNKFEYSVVTFVMLFLACYC